MAELRNYYPPELANRFFDTLTVIKGNIKNIIGFSSRDPPDYLWFDPAFLLSSVFYHLRRHAVGLIYIVFRFTARKGLDTSLQESKYKYKVAHWIQEVVRSLVTFKLSARLPRAPNDKLTADYLNAGEHFRVLMLQFIQMIGFKTLVTAGLLIIGGYWSLNNK